MSRTLSMNCGSGESLNVSTWCGFNPNARQIRLTALWLIPVAVAIDRVDQCVASEAAPRASSRSPARPSSSLIVRGFPGRGSSCNPSMPRRANRPRHFPTVESVAAKLGRDLVARPPLRCRQHDPAAKRQRLRALRSPSPPLKHLPLLTTRARPPHASA